MDVTVVGTLVIGGLFLLLLLGTPVAFALGGVSVTAILLTEGIPGLNYFGETFYSRMSDFSLVAVPMFIVMGAAVASTPTGRDLYRVLDRSLRRVPGGLAISNIGACGIFAALSGSSPATCAAIGKMGIPEMIKRGYPDRVAAGSIAAGGTLGILIPPSITMIVYGIATETSIGRLFFAGIVPGLLLVGLFMAWTLFASARSADISGLRTRTAAETGAGDGLGHTADNATFVRVLPFLAIVVGILFVLYGGVATPSEAAGVGAFLCILFTAVIYRIWRVGTLTRIFRDSLRESVMIMMIIAGAEVFAYVLSSLFITQSIAGWIAALAINRWLLMGLINVFLLVAGFFLPPVAVIVMTAPILMPIILNAGFDPYWFGVILTINLEIGLITPPVGLNLFIINGIAPDITLRDILMGSLPYVICMVVAIVVLCVFPQLALWLPNTISG
ncbi:MAG TPA: TRAP transporter large permease [Gammaproteobacteria bacterium]|nr:TRAP transporter large permease [Gammaproteobacteria bacterium]